MILFRTPLLLLLVISLASCRRRSNPKEVDKVFFASPVNSGFGVMFFSLYKGNEYQFCDGDFMDPGCYTGFYTLSGDTIILDELKQHKNIPTNRFLIRRYYEMDSIYWLWKYPDDKHKWKEMRRTDSSIGSIGDVFPLDSKGKIVFDRNNYFIVRADNLDNIP